MRESNIKIKTLEEEECYKAWQEYSCEYILTEKVPDAIWDFPIIRPEPPKDPSKIAGWGKPKKDRKFPYYADDLMAKMSEGFFADDSTKENDKYLSFIDDEYERRYNGFFFFNGDNLEWITDRHYMFLQYWKMPVTVGRRKKSARPKFKDAQKDVYYTFWFTREDKTSAGVLFTSCRRFGKTAIVCSDGYWDTTENSESRFAIQSKTDIDARKVFNKIVKSWRKLPDFWKPIDKGESTVSTSLAFTEPKKKDTKSRRKEYSEVLDSEIFFTNRSEEALDSDYASYIFHDEAGKLPKHVDCNERWNISRECLIDNGKIIGFGVVTTTVEDMEKYGSEKYLELHDRSNPNKRNPDGKTDSYLYRLFIPCYYGFEGDEEVEASFVDEWGYTNTVEAKKFFKKMYEAKSGDMSYRRKYPITIEDAFSVRDDHNNYNQRKIYEQLTYNARLEPIAQPVVGNFMWEGGIKDTNVVFKPNPDGKWEVSWMPPEEDRNKKEMYGGHWKPNRTFCKTGADPFAHRATTEGGSMGAAYTILESHHKYPQMKRAWVCKYLARTNHPHEQAEDMIMQNVFYSSEFLCEKNVYGVLDYFHKRGYDGYCMFNPLDPDSVKKRIKGHRGMPMTGSDAGEALSNLTQAHIEDYIGFHEETKTHGFCPFHELLTDWQKFNPNKRTEFDSAMAAGMALIALQKPKYTVETSYKPSDWLPKYNNSGSISRRVR